MNKYLDYIYNTYQEFIAQIPKVTELFYKILVNANWSQIIQVGFFLLLSMFLFFMVVFLTNWIFDSYTKNKTRVHHLKIQNKGNTPSIYLLRTIDLPQQLAVRFRSGGNPMIWVSQRDPVAEKEKQRKEAEEKQAAEMVKKTETQGLIPDLKAPMEKEGLSIGDTVKASKNELQDVGKKAGFVASFLANIANLLPIKSPKISQVQAEMKDIQQGTNEAIGTINTKAGSVNSLKSQVESLGIKTQIPEDAKAMINSGMQAEIKDIAVQGDRKPDDKSLSSRVALRNFVYDEDVWHSNLGKVDSMGGSLNYVQSRILNPGEEMDIDIEILNMNEASTTLSLVYKLEVIQVPQTRLPIAAPHEFIRGTVVCPKNSILRRLGPFMLDMLLIIIAVQILALYSHIVFK